jgi:protoheme ferro-lyase
MAYYRAVAQAAASTPERIGVLVVNLGTPDSPSYFAVQRYLAEFLGDRRVINTSRWIWLPLLYGVVLPLRPLRTARNYRKVWMEGGSPLAVYSQRLTQKIGALLQHPAIAFVSNSHDLWKPEHRRRDPAARRAERQAPARAAALPAVLFVDDRIRVRSDHGGAIALALAAGNPLRQ